MANLLCLLIGIALTLAGIGLALRRGFRPLAAASAYRNVAWRLGLEADTRGVSLRGQLRGRSLFVGAVTQHDERAQLVGSIQIVPPLGLGLHVKFRHRRMRERIQRNVTSAPDTALPRLSETFELDVRGREIPALDELFDDTVCDGVQTLLADASEVEVSDHWIRLQLSRPLTDEDRLSALVATLEGLAYALEAARTRLPPPEALQAWVEPWRTLAQAHDLDFVDHLPGIHGTWKGHAVTVWFSRDSKGDLADVRLDFGPHRALGLHIQPQNAPQGDASLGQDIHFEEPAFDDAFVIKGYDPGGVLSTCVPQARAALLKLDQLGHVDVSDVRIVVSGLPPTPDVLERALVLASSVAHAFAW